jgi:hypothetical protein
MTYQEAQRYENGKRFARAYCKTYGLRDAIRGVRVVAIRESIEYTAGMCDALLELLQASR